MNDEFFSEAPLDEEEEEEDGAPVLDELLLLAPVLEDDDEVAWKREGTKRFATPDNVTAAPTANARPYIVTPELMVIDAVA